MSDDVTFIRGENPLKADKLNLAFSKRVNRHGDSMDGPLYLNGDPTMPFEAATKQYVDRFTAMGVPTGAYIGPTPPGNTLAPLWWNNTDGQLYVEYDNGTTTEWVPANSTVITPALHADELNVLDFYNGTFVSGGNITDALLAALATGKNVYMPGGYVYRIYKQITVGVNGNTAQRLRGDGKSTYILYEASFDPLASCHIRLNGAETNGPTIQDLRILCAQSTTATNRADFVTLGTPGAGTGLKGIKYPPVITFGAGCNRFRIERVRISNCWDGIIQDPGASSGGWWIRDIEMSAYNRGLDLSTTKDFCHLHGWHHWYYEQTAANQAVMRDGQVICMKFGTGGETEGINISEVNNFTGRIIIDHAAGWLQMSNIMMDGDNATIDHVTQAWTQITNLYFTCSSAGPSGGEPSIRMRGGYMHIVNMHGWAGLQPFIQQSGGILSVGEGYMLTTVKDVPLLSQTGGILRMDHMELRAVTPSAWTVPVMNCTGGTTHITNCWVTVPSVGDVGFINLSADNVGHRIAGNNFGGWKFTPPGTLGDYQTGADFYTKSIHAGGMTIGGAAVSGASYQLHATGQKTINFVTNNAIRWAVGATSAGGGYGADEYAVLRYNDAQVLQPVTFKIYRTGIIQLSQSGTIASYGTDPAVMPAQIGWRGFGVFSDTLNVTPIQEIVHIADTPAASVLAFRKARGTSATPATQVNNDAMGAVFFGGYDGTAWANSAAYIRAFANGTWSTSNHNAHLYFYTTEGTTQINPLVLNGTTAIFPMGLTVMQSGPTLRAGAGVPVHADIAGSQWTRTDGTAGARIYVNQGGTTWLPIAGV
jgi:hypothetical protein